jgi:hypothetical protein
MAEVAGRIVMIEKNFKRLKEAGAFSPETAVKAEEVGITSRRMLKDLIEFKNVKKTEDNRYYISCERKHL